MKIGIIREGKKPSDRRVPLSPKQCLDLKNMYPHISLVIQPSSIRCFSDQEYIDNGLVLQEDLSDCDLIMGIKEVPIDFLIPKKKFLFFSHTIKKQPYNQNLLKEIIRKKIDLIDYEVLKSINGERIIGFGRYAGIVGAYNAFLTYGLKMKKYNLKPAYLCVDKQEMEEELKKVKTGNLKIILTGNGRVSRGAEEILKQLNIKQVSKSDFLTKDFSSSVYTCLTAVDYYETLDSKSSSKDAIYKYPKKHKSCFSKYLFCSDMLITGHFYDSNAPFLFTKTDIKNNKKLKVVADISCDIDGPVACTIRPSKIISPIYGYNPISFKEDDYLKDHVIAVMAVDNLPCELPKDASIYFGQELLQKVIPSFINDNDGIIKKGTITHNGVLTEKFKYLEDFIS